MHQLLLDSSVTAAGLQYTIFRAETKMQPRKMTKHIKRENYNLLLCPIVTDSKYVAKTLLESLSDS